MSAKHFILATAGHVDHGKSALVKALTGIDPDRLPEEKERGITIDLGFAHLELPAPSPAAVSQLGTQNPEIGTFRLGIVDVPGHEDFVKNMVAGVGSVDLALFVVAADDGWMPQTEEHLQILTYLGVTRAVVALTKIDLAEDEASMISSVQTKLRDTPFANAPIVPTSVVTGRGLDELKATFAQVLADAPFPRDIGKPRLPVDRVFTLRGIGTVVTGTLTGGSLSRGQSVVIQPIGRATRVRSIQSHNREVEASGPGTRTAVNLPDVETEEVRRGHILTLSELGAPRDTLDVLLEKSPRLTGNFVDEKVKDREGARSPSFRAASRALKDGALVRIHIGTANFPARIILFDQKQIAPGEQAVAQLRFEPAVFAFAGDRFIVRDWAEQATLAGGIVLDPDARRNDFRSEGQQTFLRRRAQSAGEVDACVETLLARDGVTQRVALLVKSNFSAEEISQAVTRLAETGKIIPLADLVASAKHWMALRQRAAEGIDAEHRAHPELAGLPLNQLRAILENDLPSPEVFNTLIADLCKNGFVQVGVAIQRAGYRPALPPHLQAAGAKIRAALVAKPFEPPSRKELAPDGVALQALRFLRETGEVIELGEELVLLTDSFTRMKEVITKFIRKQGPATVSDLRQSLGTTRRVVMPLLERLDREGVTLRQGEHRVLGKKS